MKKMRNGRKGFTLLEIVAVVAIIVILSTAAFLGVAATLNKASEAQKNLQMNNGDSFEWYARSQVDAYGKSQVTWDPIPNYTPENKAKKIKNHMISEEGWTDGEITFEYQEDGWHIIANWDPTLEAHHGLQTPEDYKLWKSNYDNYLSQGYTEDELEAGIIQGSTDLKPVWDPQNHKGLTYEQYQEELKKQQNGSQGGGSGSGSSGSGSSGSGSSGSGSSGSGSSGSGSSGSGSSGSGTSGSTTVSFGQASTGYVGYANQGHPGVMSISDAGTDQINVRFTDGWDNHNPGQDTCTVSITKTAGGYVMKVIDGNTWVATQITGYNYEKEYTLTNKDLEDLKNNTGLILS